MPAINYDEDTEFNDALRRHGILPPKQANGDGQGEEEERPATPPRASSPSLSDLDDLDDLALDVDDSVSRAKLEAEIARRRQHERDASSKRKFGRVFPIGKPDYKREVTDASEEQLEGEPDGWGTGVVCVLHKDSVPASKFLMPLIHQLASLYPSTKFVSIVSDQCIENYPDKNVPTIIVYRNGKMMGQVVGIDAYGGEKAKLIDVERFLFAFRGIDFHLKVGYDQRAYSDRVAQFSSKSDAMQPHDKTSGSTVGGGTALDVQSRSRTRGKGSDDDSDEDSEDDQTFVGGGRRSGIRQSKRSTNDSDDEFDL